MPSNSEPGKGDIMSLNLVKEVGEEVGKLKSCYTTRPGAF